MKGVGGHCISQFWSPVEGYTVPSYCDLRSLLLYYSIRRKDQRSCTGGMEVGGHNIWTTLLRIFSKTGISYYNINFAKRNSKAAIGRGKELYSLGCNVAQLGCSVTHKGAAQLRRVQLSSQGAAQLLGAAQLKQSAAQLSRVQHSLVGCSVAQKSAAQLTRVQLTSVGHNLAQ